MRQKDPDPEFLARKAAELNDRTELNRGRFVRSEIFTAESFCRRAETELRMGERKHAQKAISEANKALRSAKEWLKDVGPEKEELAEALRKAEEKVKEIAEAA